MKARTLLSALLAFALIAAACGDDDDSSDETTTAAPETTTTAAPPETTATTAPETTVTTASPDTTTTTAAGSGLSLPTLGSETVPYANRCDFADNATASACIAIRDYHQTQAHLEALDALGTDEQCLVVPGQLVTTASEALLAAAFESSRDFRDSKAALEQEYGNGLGRFALGNADPIAAAELVRELGMPASPSYYVIPTPRWKWGPGGDAVPAPPQTLAPAVPARTDGPVVTVIDTGYPDDGITFSNLQQAGPTEPAGLGRHFQGHGLFVAGVVRSLANDSEVFMRSPYATGVLANDGELATVPVASETSIAFEMIAALRQELEDGGVLNISGGTYPCGPDDIPLGLASAAATLNAAGITIVASAGNDALAPTLVDAGGRLDLADPSYIPDVIYPAGLAFQKTFDTPFYENAKTVSFRECYNAIDAWAQSDERDINPALDGEEVEQSCNNLEAFQEVLQSEYENVLSVGAGVAGTAVAAPFSNLGATHWAPGVNVVSPYPPTFSWIVSGTQYDSTGFAQWDGTSFAAPYVAGFLSAGHDVSQLAAVP